MPSRCDACATELAPALLVCPSCHALVHRARLEELAREAGDAAAAKEFTRAGALWRSALALLPEGSTQASIVAQRVDAMNAAASGKTLEEMRQGPPAGSIWAKILGPFGAAGLLVWKLKFLIVALLTKGKLLLLGLTKLSTIASMFVSFGVYWRAWGWQFAAVIILGIYIHEMGHVAELRRRGLPASAPMFVPAFGAFVRMHEHPTSPREDARVGLAGPLWGLGAAVAALVVALITKSAFWFAATHLTAVINLFNLTPVWQLDGSRGVHPLSRLQRVLLVGVIAAAWGFSREKMLVLVALVLIWRAAEKQSATAHDWPVFTRYAMLIVAFAALALAR